MDKATLYKLMMDKMAFGKENQKITDANLRGKALGNEDSQHLVCKQTDRPAVLKSHPGDRKSAKYRNQVGWPLDSDYRKF